MPRKFAGANNGSGSVNIERFLVALGRGLDFARLALTERLRKGIQVGIVRNAGALRVDIPMGRASKQLIPDRDLLTSCWLFQNVVDRLNAGRVLHDTR